MDNRNLHFWNRLHQRAFCILCFTGLAALSPYVFCCRVHDYYYCFNYVVIFRNRLILTQGVLYAIGSSLLYSLSILYLEEWFINRKGFAFGVMWARTWYSGIVVPFIMSWGLQAYGFRTMLRT